MHNSKNLRGTRPADPQGVLGRLVKWTTNMQSISFPTRLLEPHACFMNSYVTLRTCTIRIIHACTTIIIYACALMITHACAMMIVHAYTMIIIRGWTWSLYMQVLWAYISLVWPKVTCMYHERSTYMYYGQSTRIYHGHPPYIMSYKAYVQRNVGRRVHDARPPEKAEARDAARSTMLGPPDKSFVLTMVM